MREFLIGLGAVVTVACSNSGQDTGDASLAVNINSAETIERHFACLTEEWLNDMYAFVAAEDWASVQAYLDSEKCLPMMGGLAVTVTQVRPVSGYREFSLQEGLKFWTIREGLSE